MKLKLLMLLFMSAQNHVLYEDIAVVTLVLYDVMLLFINMHHDVLYADNAVVTLILHDVMLLLMKVVNNIH